MIGIGSECMPDRSHTNFKGLGSSADFGYGFMVNRFGKSARNAALRIFGILVKFFSHKKPRKETKLCYPFSFIAPQQFEDLDEIVINNTQEGFRAF